MAVGAFCVLRFVRILAIAEIVSQKPYAMKMHLGSESMKASAARKFLKDKSGATAIEYALIAGGLSIVIVIAVNSLGSVLSGTFTKVSAGLK
jgi:pilus assembly protein Flp/PilA